MNAQTLRLVIEAGEDPDEVFTTAWEREADALDAEAREVWDGPDCACCCCWGTCLTDSYDYDEVWEQALSEQAEVEYEEDLCWSWLALASGHGPLTPLERRVEDRWAAMVPAEPFYRGFIR